jgi:Tat protein secretion system quality control protein TatD with DNase activity
MIDIGANLAHNSFAHDWEAVLDRARAAGVTTIIVTGTSVAASRAAAALAEDRAPQLYATAGVHPHDASQFAGTASCSMTGSSIEVAPRKGAGPTHQDAPHSGAAHKRYASAAYAAAGRG